MNRRAFIRSAIGGVAAACGVGALAAQAEDINDVFVQDVQAKDYVVISDPNPPEAYWQEHLKSQVKALRAYQDVNNFPIMKKFFGDERLKMGGGSLISRKVDTND